MTEVGATGGPPFVPEEFHRASSQKVDLSDARAAYALAIQGTHNAQERHAEVGILPAEGPPTFARLGKDKEYGSHRVGSVTKTFTTFLALTLNKKGVFPNGLDTKLSEILTDEKMLASVFEDVNAAKKMTLAQLLSHTSGMEIDDHCYQPNQKIPSVKPATLQERFLQESTRESGRKYKHITQPGDGIGFYSNAGLAVACWMMEAAYNRKFEKNMPFSQIMKQELFENVFKLSDSLMSPGPSGDIIQSGAGDMYSTTQDLMEVAKLLQQGEDALAGHFGQGWQTQMLQGRDIFNHHGLGCEANAPVIKHFGLNREMFGTEERDVTAVVEFPLRRGDPGLVAMCDSTALGPKDQEQNFIRTLEAAAQIEKAPEDGPPKPQFNTEFYCPPKAFLFHGNSYLATHVNPFQEAPPKEIVCSRNGMRHTLTQDRAESGITQYHDEYGAPWLFITKENDRKIVFSPFCLLTHVVKGVDIAAAQPDAARCQLLQGVYKNTENPQEHPTFIFTESNGRLFMKEEGDEKSYPCLFIPDAAGGSGSWVSGNPEGPKLQFRFPDNPDTGYLFITDIFTGVQQLPHHCQRVK